VIVGLDDDEIRSMDDLLLHVRRREVGEQVTLKLYRDGEYMELQMTVGEKPANLEIPQPEEQPAPDQTP
jgi:S1-C subfamily serine protease